MDEVRAAELEGKLSNLIYLKKQTAEELATWQEKQNLDVIGDENAFQALEDKMGDLDKEIAEVREAVKLAKGANLE